MTRHRTLLLRREVLTGLTDSSLASVVGAETPVTIHATWCVLCITYVSCAETCDWVTWGCPP